MKPWRFSDGTVVHLGGEVEGATLFAQELRRDIPLVQSLAEPGFPVDEKFDPSNASQLDCLLRREVRAPYWSWQLLRLIDAPQVEAYVAPHVEYTFDPDVIY